MTVLIALVVILGVLALANLLLTVAVARRLRTHTDTLAGLTGAATPDSGLPPGTAVPRLRAVAHDGAEIGTGEAELLAFVAASCAACRTHLPGLLAAAGRSPVTVVVSGDPAAGTDLVRLAEPVARVLTEAGDGPWALAFGVQVFPTFLRLRDGVVVARGPTAADVAAGAPA
jgi:hypothetical protein